MSVTRVALRPAGSGVCLALGRDFLEQAHHQLRVGLHVAPRGVVPYVERGLAQRVEYRVEKSHAVDARLVAHVIVVVFERVDAVVHRLQVLGDENAVGIGSATLNGLLLTIVES